MIDFRIDKGQYEEKTRELMDEYEQMESIQDSSCNSERLKDASFQMDGLKHFPSERVPQERPMTPGLKMNHFNSMSRMQEKDNLM